MVWNIFSNFAILFLIHIIMKKISFIISLLFICLSIVGQISKLRFDGCLMFTDVYLNEGNTSRLVNSMIDTGCSFCTIDSTYLVDNFKVDTNDLVLTDMLDAKKNCLSIKIDSFSFCGLALNNVFCIVLDMKSIFKNHAPDFIVGANVLHRHSWKFDMKDSTISLYDRCTEKGTNIKWKSHNDYKDVNLGFIVFEGKVGEKKNRFVFDTGTKYCYLQKDFYTGKKEIIKKESGNIYQPYAIRELELFKDVNFSIAKKPCCLNFFNGHPHGNFGLLNISFLKGKSFVLNYPKKILTIID